MPKPDTVGPMLWLEHAALAHLLDPTAGEAFRLVPRRVAMDVNASVTDISSWLASRAIWRQYDGEAPWGQDVAAFLNTPSDVRRTALLDLTAPNFAAPKAGKPVAAPILPKRKPKLKAFADDPNAPLTMHTLVEVARRYIQVVDHALATPDAPVRAAAFAEAQAMRDLLTRPVTPPPKEVYRRETHDVHALMLATGSNVFLDAGEACSRKTNDPTGWAYAQTGFSQDRGFQLDAIVNRAEASFITDLAPKLDRANAWTLVVLVQHKPVLMNAALNALGTLSPSWGCPSWGCGQNEGTGRSYLGEALDARGGSLTDIGNTDAMWAIVDPSTRVDVFSRYENGKGFFGMPGRNVESFEIRHHSDGLFLLAAMRHAYRNGTTFANAAAHVTAPSFVHDLVKTGQGEDFMASFSSIEAFVATPWETIADRARSLIAKRHVA